jgi:hypothetical protein
MMPLPVAEEQGASPEDELEPTRSDDVPAEAETDPGGSPLRDCREAITPVLASHLHATFDRSSVVKSSKYSEYSCGFTRSSPPNLTHIWERSSEVIPSRALISDPEPAGAPPGVAHGATIASGRNTVLWTDVAQEEWVEETDSFDPSELVSLRFQIPSSMDERNDFELCLSNLTVLP